MALETPGALVLSKFKVSRPTPEEITEAEIYVASAGMRGSLPDWYRLGSAAHVLGVSPWQLAERDDWEIWAEIALSIIKVDRHKGRWRRGA